MEIYIQPSSSFEVKTLDSLDEQEMSSFSVGGFYAFRGYLSNIIPELMDLPTYQIETNALIYNPIIEVKIRGFSVQSEKVLHLLEDFFAFQLEETTQQQLVIILELSGKEKFELCKTIPNTIYTRENIWIGEGFTINEIVPHLESLFEKKVLIKNFLPLENEELYNWEIPIGLSFDECVKYFSDKYQIQISTRQEEVKVWKVFN